MKNFSKFEALTSNEMAQISGGSDGWALIIALWNATEEGGCTTVTNQGDGTFTGTHTVQSGSSMPQVDYVIATESLNGQWGVGKYRIS